LPQNSSTTIEGLGVPVTLTLFRVEITGTLFFQLTRELNFGQGVDGLGLGIISIGAY